MSGGAFFSCPVIGSNRWLRGPVTRAPAGDSPELGEATCQPQHRFLSRDRWGGWPTASQTLNRYLYANGNPLTHTDPTGHGPGAVTNPGGCLVGLAGSAFLSYASLYVGLAGLSLQGASVAAFGLSLGASAPVSGAGIAAGFMLEGIAIVGEAAAIGLIKVTCIDVQDPR